MPAHARSSFVIALPILRISQHKPKAQNRETGIADMRKAAVPRSRAGLPDR